MSEKKEIYARLAKMIEECSERIKVCTPSTDYYSRPGDTNEETITIVNTFRLIQLLEDEAAGEE